MLVIMVCFKLYATVSRSAALIEDVSVALVQLQASTGSRWQQRQMISPTEYIHNLALGVQWRQARRLLRLLFGIIM